MRLLIRIGFGTLLLGFMAYISPIEWARIPYCFMCGMYFDWFLSELAKYLGIGKRHKK